ncbi:MAG TPA: ATPase, T2SS/T4P/T4SS family [Polyangiaceae bacterium]|nr:ATPase, T2SS/T4P/T4SS family [Polyangiaceae bacterium]
MDVDVVIQAEDGSRQVRRLNARGVISVGRSPRSALYLESDLVSRQHILVDVYEQGLRVEDTSTNGTLAGATLLRRSAAEVPFGTPIVVGNYTLLFQPADDAAEPPSNPTVVSADGEERPPTVAPSALPRPAPMPTVPGATPEPPRAAAPVRPSQRPPRPPAPPGRRSSDAGAKAPGAAPSGPPPAAPSVPPAPAAPAFAAAPAAPAFGPAFAAAPAAPAFAPAFAAAPPAPFAPQAVDAETALRRELHRQLAEQLDASALDPGRGGDLGSRAELQAAVRRLLRGAEGRLPPRADAEALAAELADEAIGLGPLGELLNDPLVEEILVVDPRTIYAERDGRRERVNARFTDEDRVLVALGRLLAPAGVRLDGRAPFVEARLGGGLHVHAALPPLSSRGPCVTVRKAARAALSLERLVRVGALDEAVARFLSHSVAARKNVLVSGGQGTGKTALLAALAAAFGPDERVVTVEDVGELGLRHPHLIALVAPPGEGPLPGWTPRALVHQALRMRPDRVVLGACVGDEAFELLRAMHAGCDGSMTTINAHSPREALARFEALARSGSPSPAGTSVRQDIAAALHLVVQQTRYHDGSRKVSAVSEVTGIDPETGELQLSDIFRFERTGADGAGRVLGAFRPTGHLPTFLQALVEQGLVPPGGPYL